MFWTSLINLARRNPVKQDFFALVISSHFMAFTIIFLIFTSLPYTLIFFMFTLMFLQWAFPEKSVRLPLNPLEYQSTLPWPPLQFFIFLHWPPGNQCFFLNFWCTILEFQRLVEFSIDILNRGCFKFISLFSLRWYNRHYTIQSFYHMTSPYTANVKPFKWRCALYTITSNRTEAPNTCMFLLKKVGIS